MTIVHNEWIWKEGENRQKGKWTKTVDRYKEIGGKKGENKERQKREWKNQSNGGEGQEKQKKKKRNNREGLVGEQKTKAHNLLQQLGTDKDQDVMC